MRYGIENLALLVLGLACKAGQTPVPAAHSGASALSPVSTRLLDVASGKIETAKGYDFAVHCPTLRLVAPSVRAPGAKLVFTYQGPSEKMVALASGEERRQIGLKLRSQDACNVVYVMWHIAPETSRGIFVQVKSNPGQSTSGECHDHGYRTIAANRSGAVPALGIGERHSLTAVIDKERLTVLADDQPVWEGTLPKEAFAFDGPIGVRTDNGNFAVRLLAAPALASGTAERANAKEGVSDRGRQE